MLDIYTDYLIFQNKHATATGLSDMLEGDITYDKVTRFFRLNEFGSKSLWNSGFNLGSALRDSQLFLNNKDSKFPIQL